MCSVNSINIGRVTVQTFHYFWAYLRAIEALGDEFTIGTPLTFAIVRPHAIYRCLRFLDRL